MMAIIPPHIIHFIQQNHVVNFAAHNQQDFWAANCFYAFDSTLARLIILTSKTTRHGQLMSENPQIVGTISAQVEAFTDIEGIQFSAQCKCLEETNERQQALSLYYKRHPLARLKSSDVWELRFDMIKHTGNKVIFAKKTIWQREDL
nr:hypothetical protein [Actinobacillus vicugnae]